MEHDWSELEGWVEGSIRLRTRLRTVAIATACVVCCGLPMLVAAGGLTAAGAAIGGVAGAAAGAAIFFAGHLGFRRRGWWAVVTLLCGLAGAAVAVAGLSELAGDDGQGRWLVSVSIALLAAAGLSALAPGRDEGATAR